MQLEKIYEPQRFEPHWAQWWVDSGIFRASRQARRQGLLAGHSAAQRHRRRSTWATCSSTPRSTSPSAGIACCGENTLWLPGTDHAGIATQMVVERKLAEEGINRRDLGREEFEERVWEWKAEYGGTIKRQMIRLGA